MRLVAVVLWFAISIACSNGSATPAQAFRIPVVVETDDGDVRFMAEVADEPAEREKGLMFREVMQGDHGMIFLFPQAKQQSFWMKNTFIPLDIIFVRADRTILGIVAQAEPKTTTSRRVEGQSQFVLELNGGVAAQQNLAPGQKLRFTAPLPQE